MTAPVQAQPGPALATPAIGEPPELLDLLAEEDDAAYDAYLDAIADPHLTPDHLMGVE